MRAFTDELRAIEGVAELVASLTVPICVATNSHPDRVRHSLEVTGLWSFFDPHVFSAFMVERGKPAPDPLPICGREVRGRTRRLSRTGKTAFMGLPQFGRLAWR